MEISPNDYNTLITLRYGVEIYFTLYLKGVPVVMSEIVRAVMRNHPSLSLEYGNKWVLGTLMEMLRLGIVRRSKSPQRHFTLERLVAV